MKKEKLSASLEDYLEAIYQIILEKNAVRAKDIAEKLGVAAPSVTSALRALAKKKMVNHEPYDVITLTSRGKEVARDVLRRHVVLKDFFTEILAVEEALAEACACRMEHAVPDEVLERFIEYLKFEQRCHLGGTEWVEGTGFICNAQADQGKLCNDCTKQESGTCAVSRSQPRE